MAHHGKRVLKARETVERTKLYKLEEAVKLVKGAANAKFDETVELSINLGVDPKHADQMVRGVVNLPNGTGRTLRVAVFARGAKADEARAAGADVVGAEDLVAAVQGGEINFDRCIATPDMMPLVGRLGKVLGPRGLMPNPKVGTVTMDVKAAVAASKGGAVEFRAEKAGIVQGSVGKASFGDDKLDGEHSRFRRCGEPSQALRREGTLPLARGRVVDDGPGRAARPRDAADGDLGRDLGGRSGRQNRGGRFGRVPAVLDPDLAAGVSSGARSQEARPTDPNQSIVRTVERKFVHAPRLVVRLPENLACESCGGAVDILPIEIEAERVAPGLKPSCDCRIEMDMGAKSVREHPVVVGAAGVEREAQALEERLRRVQIIARQNCRQPLVHGPSPRSRRRGFLTPRDQVVNSAGESVSR